MSSDEEEFESRIRHGRRTPVIYPDNRYDQPGKQNHSSQSYNNSPAVLERTTSVGHNYASAPKPPFSHGPELNNERRNLGQNFFSQPHTSRLRSSSRSSQESYATWKLPATPPYVSDDEDDDVDTSIGLIRISHPSNRSVPVSSPYKFMCATISKDNTMGEDVRKSEILADFGRKLQRMKLGVEAEPEIPPPLPPPRRLWTPVAPHPDVKAIERDLTLGTKMHRLVSGPTENDSIDSHVQPIPFVYPRLSSPLASSDRYSRHRDLNGSPYPMQVGSARMQERSRSPARSDSLNQDTGDIPHSQGRSALSTYSKRPQGLTYGEHQNRKADLKAGPRRKDNLSQLESDLQLRHY